MPDGTPPRRRETLTGRKIKQYLNQKIKIFLDNGIAMEGVLLDYFYDPVEKDGCITLSSHRGPGLEPSIVFRRFVTTIQPAPGTSGTPQKRKP